MKHTKKKSSDFLSEKTKKDLALALRHDSKFIKHLFSTLIKNDLQYLDRTKDRKDPENFDEKISNEFLHTFVNQYFKSYRVNVVTQVALFQFLEIICLNLYAQNEQLRKLALAFDLPENARRKKIIVISNKLKIEDKAVSEAIRKIKKMNKITKWWDRRLNDLKAGDINERI
jgi:hypothetical protein